jgi:membrane-associated phospholipid phosphatase
MFEHFFLFFAHDAAIVPLLLIGVMWSERSLFRHATYLILISMIINYALKITFQIPLAPHLHKVGFAFPSGHMQSSFVFYGWLSQKMYPKKYFLLLTLLIIFIAISLIKAGYHNLYDILGAVFFGSLLLSGYHRYIEKNRRGWLPIISISTFSMLYTYFKYLF